MNAFTMQVIRIIKAIPQGKVMTYGQIAAYAGNPRGARQVSRILHSMSGKHELPWFRVVNSQGKVSLREGSGGELQTALLISEGVVFDFKNRIDLRQFAVTREELEGL